jgi:hypothetical protein
MTKRLERIDKLLHALAEYLAGDQAAKSIILELERDAQPIGHRWAEEWANLRDASGLIGWPTVEDAYQHLRDLLG